MVISQYIAVLDACVLAPMPLADTLLRLAEEPALYAPRWSIEIPDEVSTTLAKFGYSGEQIKGDWQAGRPRFIGADEFLVCEYRLDPDVFIETLRRQAVTIGRGLPEQLDVLARHAPNLTELMKL